jgi:hypothetical protein
MAMILGHCYSKISCFLWITTALLTSLWHQKPSLREGRNPQRINLDFGHFPERSMLMGICELRKDYSPNSDIWFLRRDWHHIKDEMLVQINTGTYQFSPLNRYEFDDATLSLWTSQELGGTDQKQNGIR